MLKGQEEERILMSAVLSDKIGFGCVIEYKSMQGQMVLNTLSQRENK